MMILTTSKTYLHVRFHGPISQSGEIWIGILPVQFITHINLKIFHFENNFSMANRTNRLGQDFCFHNKKMLDIQNKLN
jgi:hypothetical protein